MSTGRTVKEDLDLCELRVNLHGVEEAKKLSTQETSKLRFSYLGPLKYGSDDRPLCPIGRTGLKGRVLGNW